jgi:prepilin-type N-terminal cleavage/methylation domain-containing protein
MNFMQRERGFTLVEVLAALLILTFVITTSLYAFLERNKRLQQAAEIIIAYQALSNEAEYWRRDAYATLDDLPKTFRSDPSVLLPLEPYSTVVNVEDVKPGIKSVTMTVRWHNSERVARLAILRADTGGQPLW